MEQDPGRGGDALRLPEALTEHMYPRRAHYTPWLISLKGCSGAWMDQGGAWRRLRLWLHAEGVVQPWEQLKVGLSRGSVGRGLCNGSMTPTAQALEHRVTGTQPRIWHSPPGQAEVQRAQDSKDTPAPS